MISSLHLESVQAAIAALLSVGYPTIERTAHALGCSPRTLQRRLHDSGTTYGQLVDRVRVEAARRLLEDENLHLYEIAAALRFADPSSFSRFFRRTNGVTPREYRPAQMRS